MLIEWSNAQSDCEWGNLDRIKKWADEDCIVYDIGWIIYENKKYIIIASQMGKDDGDWGNRTKIPKEWIRKRTKMVVN